MTGALLVLLLTATPSEIEQRVERVVNGLLPSAAFTGRCGTRAKLDYATKSGVKLSVTRTEGGLRLAAEGQPPIDLTAESETKLHTPMLNTEFVFASAEKDRPASLTLSQGGRQTTAEKVALAPSEEKETK